MRLDIGENDFQRTIIHLLRLYGFRVAHFRPARTAHGWATAVEADGKGFPDIIAITRSGVLLAVEVKAEKGRVAPEQREWLERFAAARGCHVCVWRPSMWEAIVLDVKGLALMDAGAIPIQPVGAVGSLNAGKPKEGV